MDDEASDVYRVDIVTVERTHFIEVDTTEVVKSDLKYGFSNWFKHLFRRDGWTYITKNREKVHIPWHAVCEIVIHEDETKGYCSKER